MEAKHEKNEKNEREKEEPYYDRRPPIGKKGPSRIRQQFGRGMSYFLVVAAAILFYFILLRLTNLSYGVGKIFGILKPILYGCVIAYLLNPIVRKVDQYLAPFLEARMRKKEKAQKLSRGVGILASLLILFVVVTALLNLLIPELYKSIRSMVYTLPGQIQDVLNRVNDAKLDDSTTGKVIQSALEQGTDMFMDWMRTDLLDRANEIMSDLTLGFFNVLSGIFDALIGVIVSIYILFSKEQFARQGKKAAYAIFSPHHANMLLHLFVKSNEIFGGFIIGKLIDSLIIGVLCFFGLSILNMPYVMLVSVVVGVTNVIPFFGPYIGAVPSAILILLADPMKGLYFIIFILLLQQFDGNILGPKILGNSTGLSAFWVVVAILLGGGLFGFVGMVIGVPTFAVLYYIVDIILESRLEKKRLPISSDAYDRSSYVDSEGNYIQPGQNEEESKEEGSKEEGSKERELKEEGEISDADPGTE